MSAQTYSNEFKINSAMSVLVFTGGVIGYSKAKSVPSLVAGTVFGLAFGASAYFINAGNEKLGCGLSIVASSLLAGVMGKKAYLTGKPMPIAITVGSLIAAGTSISKLYSPKA